MAPASTASLRFACTCWKWTAGRPGTCSTTRSATSRSTATPSVTTRQSRSTTWSASPSWPVAASARRRSGSSSATSCLSRTRTSRASPPVPASAPPAAAPAGAAAAVPGAPATNGHKPDDSLRHSLVVTVPIGSRTSDWTEHSSAREKTVIAHSATLEINERVAAHRRAGHSILHLGFGEAGLPVLPDLLERLRTAAPDNAYAPVAGSAPTREAAAGYWSRRGIPTGADQIVLAPGSKALLFAALAVLDGDVVLPQPSWVTYAAQAALTGKRVVGVPVPADCGGVPDPDRLEDALRAARADGADPRIVVLTLPDNPTGTLAPEPTVRRVCEIADRLGLVILSDEIYRDLTHDGSGFTSPAQLLPERTV